MNSKLSVSIDWVTFSTRSFSSAEDVITDLLGLDLCLFKESYGLNFYRKSLKYNGIMVLFDPADNCDASQMGICVNMTGSGCRTFDRYSRVAFPGLFKRLSEDDTSICSRVDLACDDFFGLIDLDVIAEAVRTGCVRSRLTKYSIIESYEGDCCGKTIYLGSSKSAFRCRIYDKAAERGKPEEKKWVRWELVLRDQYSDSFIDLIQSVDLGLYLSSFLKSKLDFIVKDNCNISRCSVAPWWSDFLSQFIDIQFAPVYSREDDDIYRKEDYFIYQLAPTFSLLYDALGFDFFHKLYHEGKLRRSSRNAALLEEWFLKKGKVFV